jgi:hypothetical protein
MGEFLFGEKRSASIPKNTTTRGNWILELARNRQIDTVVQQLMPHRCSHGDFSLSHSSGLLLDRAAFCNAKAQEQVYATEVGVELFLVSAYAHWFHPVERIFSVVELDFNVRGCMEKLFESRSQKLFFKLFSDESLYTFATLFSLWRISSSTRL